MSIFKEIPLLPEDPILGIIDKFDADTRENKVDLSVGVYRNEELKTIKFASVTEAEKLLLEKETTKNYLPICGHEIYLQKIKELIFGEELSRELQKNITGAQTVGATSALRVAAEFIRNYIGKNLYVSNPTWPNHIKVGKAANLMIATYPYYDEDKKEVDFTSLCDFFMKLEEKSVVLMQPSCQNPTGCDLEKDQWEELVTIFSKKKLIPFFDMAYQGLGKGLEEDAFAVRLFAKSKLEFLLATSYSKNFGLYGERVGSLFFVTKNEENKQNIHSAVKSLIREIYSNPPLHGAAIVAEILSDATLKEKWQTEVTGVRKRITEMRNYFTENLIERTKNSSFSFLKNRFGLFSYTGLSKEQVKRLMEEFGIYMTSSGRINITGLNEKNIPYVVDAIARIM